MRETSTSAAAKARALLAAWDGQQSMDSAPAALFEVFWKHLVNDTFNNKLPKDQQPDGSVVVPEALRPYMRMDRITA